MGLAALWLVGVCLVVGDWISFAPESSVLRRGSVKVAMKVREELKRHLACLDKIPLGPSIKNRNE